MDLLSVGLFLGGIGWIVYNVFNWRTARFAVTNLRVMREEGLIKHRSSATMLTSLSDVRTNQGLLGQAARVRRHRHLLPVGRCRRGPVHRRSPVRWSSATRSWPRRPPLATPAPLRRRPPPRVAPVAAAAAPASSSADAADALAKLADLRDRGAITAEEFEAKKTEILARM